MTKSYYKFSLFKPKDREIANYDARGGRQARDGAAERHGTKVQRC